MFDTLLPIFIYSYAQFLKHFINSLLTTFITVTPWMCTWAANLKWLLYPGISLNNYGKYELTQITRYMLWIFTFQCKQQILQCRGILCCSQNRFACVRACYSWLYHFFHVWSHSVMSCAQFIFRSPFSFFVRRTCKLNSMYVIKSFHFLLFFINYQLYTYSFSCA